MTHLDHLVYYLLGRALEKNKILKELCLASNELNHNDAFYIGSVLKCNYHLQLLDISNNDIQDEGFRHIAEALGYQSIQVNKTSSGDSLLSNSKFDFSDLTANLNNINNNRHRFCSTPPPKIQVADDGACSNNNNNSILQCDNDDKRSESDRGKSSEVSVKGGSDVSSKVETESVAVAMISTNSAKPEDSSMKDKFKYTTASLSPISHGYDDTTTNHQIFNARSPERSFSSESLCSETSIESNDSKSSIRLIETKFNNKNGTLERQQSNVPPTAGEKLPTGLQVLILWNNNLTPKSGPSAAEMFEFTEHLQIVNFGQNPIGNEFLVDIKSTLKSNKSLTSLGLQATQLSCDGLKTLGEILQFGGNSTLQRIDLRNNELSISGLMGLSEALKSNKSIIRVDLDESPKSIMLPIYENSPEYQRWISTIRQQCAHNENPPEPQEAAKATTTVQRIKQSHLTTRKISLTCPSVPRTLLDTMKKPTGRLRSPSPVRSPIPSPLPSPSRNRFQVSRVSESSSGVSSKLTSSTSPSPSSSSGSPTFFPSNSRFRVVTVSEPTRKLHVSPVAAVEATEKKLMKNESRAEKSKEIDIPIITSFNTQAKFAPQTTFLNISNSSLLSSQSCEQLDYEVKNFIDIDSCSSFSSSIDSIDHQTDLSSTESFDLIDKSPIVLEPLKAPELVRNIELHEHEHEPEEDKKDIFSNESTLVSTSSSSSNEGLTLTTNSPSDLSPKHEAQKRIRKTSWIQSAIGVGGRNENYPATLDKLLNLFQHPSSIFTKTSPESTLASSPSGPPGKPKTSLSKDEKLSNMGQKENSISGFFNSLVSLTHKKDDKLTSCDSTTILQNISPENTVGKTSPSSQMIIESLPKSIKQELKENISPENTISTENLSGVDKHKDLPSTKVLFLVGDQESLDLPDPPEELSVADDDIQPIDDDEDIVDGRTSLGDITRDSMSILKAKSSSDELEKPLETSKLTTDQADSKQH